MGKVKIKKEDVWIDMTPMSDVMTLLLTFFMLTSTFVKPEPVKVNVPKSVSQVDVPANDVMTILVNPVMEAGKPTGGVRCSCASTIRRCSAAWHRMWG